MEGLFAQDAEDDHSTHVKSWQPAFLIDLRSTDIDYVLLAKAPFTYIIVDPDLVTVSSDELSQLRTAGKILLAYLSVGHAEVGRDYWSSDWSPDALPDFLEHVDGSLRDRYRVRFWLPEWQGMLGKYFQSHIVTKGFSGVFRNTSDTYIRRTWNKKQIPFMKTSQIKL